MNFGYLLICKQNADVDYIKLAYALALSIKNTQKQGYDKVALVLEDRSLVETLNSSWVFDEIIEHPLPEGWDGRSYMDKLTPWDNTICLDSDMLFVRDYSQWVDYFIDNCELYVPNKAYTYRGEEITQDYYRKTFTANELPNLYSFYTFFKKDSGIAADFFELQRKIIENKNEFSNLFLANRKPKVVGTDEAFALACKILDLEDEISYDLDFPRIVHLKPMVQNWPWPANKVSDHIGFYLNKKAELKIGNFQQYDVVHYVEKELITVELISMLEHIAWKK